MHLQRGMAGVHAWAVALWVLAPALTQSFVTSSSVCGAGSVMGTRQSGIEGTVLELRDRRVAWDLGMDKEVALRKYEASWLTYLEGGVEITPRRCMVLRGGADEAKGKGEAKEEAADGAGGGSQEGQNAVDEQKETVADNQNASNANGAVGGNCPHGLPPTAHCMDCEVMAFLQRAAGILQHAGGRMDSTMFARQWTLQYPDDPLTPEQVTKAVGSILKESGYFHVEETNDPDVKLFELIELSEDGQGLGDTPPTMCLPFELPPPEKDTFVDNARKWLAITGVGRHPGVGSGLMTHTELEKAIEPGEHNAGKKRHDEVQYTGKWGESLVGYWTLGPCDGSNGCVHRERINVGCRPHWTCCGSEDIHSVFCVSP